MTHSSDPHSLPGQKVDVPLPPSLCETLGYLGDARFVCFFFSPCGDEAEFDDGRSSGTARTWAFIAYRNHRAVAPLLQPYNLGYSDADAEHAIIIDRQENRASVSPIREARRFLDAQWPPLPELTLEQTEAFREEAKRLLQEWRERPIDEDAITQSIQEQQGRFGRMMSFLDMCPSPPQEGRQL